jgi:hypothetical protein
LRDILKDARFSLPPETPDPMEIIKHRPAKERPGSGQIKPLSERDDSGVFDVHVETVSFNTKED